MSYTGLKMEHALGVIHCRSLSHLLNTCFVPLLEIEIASSQKQSSAPRRDILIIDRSYQIIRGSKSHRTFTAKHQA